MTNSNPQSAGGKAWGIIQRNKAIAEYNSNPNRCKQCNKIIFLSENSKVSEIRKKKFCNKSCAAVFNNKDKPKRKFTQLNTSICIRCGVVIHLTPRKNIKGFNKRKLCAECLKISKAEVVTGKLGADLLLSNQTKSSLYLRRKNWQSANSTIRKHSRIVYESSGKEKSCFICNYSNHIEVAHIKQVKDFPDETLITDINNINNLVALCPNCHWEFDNGLIEIKCI